LRVSLVHQHSGTILVVSRFAQSKSWCLTNGNTGKEWLRR